MPDSCPDRRGDLALLAAGGLDDTETIALRGHLDGCAGCRAELTSLIAVVRRLDEADPARLCATRPAGPGPRLRGRTLDRIRTLSAGRTRRRLTAGLAAAAVAASVAVSVPALPHLSGPPGDTTVQLAGPAGTSAVATLEAKPWGTEIVIEASGLAHGERLSVWLAGRDGTRAPTGDFRGQGGRTVRVVLASAVEIEQVATVGVSDSDGQTLLSGPVR